MGAYQRGKESQSIIDNCLFLCFSFVVLAHLSFLQVWKARHPRVFALSLNLLCGLQQDLKDLMRKAGEVTFVDAHRPNRNEGWDSVLFLNVPSNTSRVSRPSDLGPNESSHSQLRVVEFASRSDMKNAISKLDGTELNGRKLKIFEDSRKWVVFFFFFHWAS